MNVEPCHDCARPLTNDERCVATFNQLRERRGSRQRLQVRVLRMKRIVARCHERAGVSRVKGDGDRGRRSLAQAGQCRGAPRRLHQVQQGRSRVELLAEEDAVERGEQALARDHASSAGRSQCGEHDSSRSGDERADRPLAVQEHQRAEPGQRQRGDRSDHRARQQILQRRPDHQAQVERALDERRVGGRDGNQGQRDDNHATDQMPMGAEDLDRPGRQRGEQSHGHQRRKACGQPGDQPHKPPPVVGAPFAQLPGLQQQ